MAAGQAPIFCDTPRCSWSAISITANTATDGTGTVATIFTAGADGSKIEDVYINHLNTNIASVVRFFINNGSTNATAANNTLIHEETLAANTYDADTASVPVIWRANLVLPAGYKLNATSGTTVAAGYQVTAVGGDF